MMSMTKKLNFKLKTSSAEEQKSSEFSDSGNWFDIGLSNIFEILSFLLFLLSYMYLKHF
jgi:hypothetical protein